ncbi:MAG TPA: nodulation protein NfeD [Steroidobacteraceae bacterium]|jgi:membrane-bound serine protease (ClpP class)|nr:nodulation protein NfeD [Steroidobacteraceae bacterium]
MRGISFPSLAVLMLALGVPVLAASPAGSQNSAPVAGAAATLLQIDGAIGPATSRYFVRGLEAAEARGSTLVILQIDTPGGLDTSMRDIIRAILAAPIPVVSYVAPSGARAASAGTYILVASHIAAMAPATNVGAATPVSIGGEEAPAPPAAPAGAPAKDAPAKDAHAVAPEPSTPMERKVVNDAAAYLQSLAELRGRNVQWAEQAVRGAASLSASDALKQHVIDLIARDVPDLLAQIDGREVRVANRSVKLATAGLSVERVDPDWRTRLLSVITHPTIAYGLLLVGLYGLLLEGYNPGVMFPGVIGVISLMLALFALQILSVNYAGLALVVLGVGMIIAEFHVPAFGSLGLGGLVAFVVGSIILFDTETPGMAIGLPLIGGVATVGGLVVLAIAFLGARAQRRPVVTGERIMVGQTAEVVENFSDMGQVRYAGELWNAHTTMPLRVGQQVRIVKVEGLGLWVEPI